MTRMVREFVEIGQCASLDVLLARLVEARRRIPDHADAEVRLAGDDIFGRLIRISYLRPQTPEEAELDARYEDAYLEGLLRRLASLQQEVARREPGRDGAAARLGRAA